MSLANKVTRTFRGVTFQVSTVTVSLYTILIQFELPKRGHFSTKTNLQPPSKGHIGIGKINRKVFLFRAQKPSQIVLALQ